MKKKYLSISLFIAIIGILSISCNNKQFAKDNNSNLQKINLDSISQKLKNFPLSWERFGVENRDTVTYEFCNASNPEFTINNGYKSVQIIIGNELYQTFNISSVYHNDSVVKFVLAPNNAGLEEFEFKWLDKRKMIGTIYIYGQESGFEFLPKEKLKNKKVIKEECNEEDYD